MAFGYSARSKNVVSISKVVMTIIQVVRYRLVSELLYEYDKNYKTIYLDFATQMFLFTHLRHTFSALIEGAERMLILAKQINFKLVASSIGRDIFGGERIGDFRVATVFCSGEIK